MFSFIFCCVSLCFVLLCSLTSTEEAELLTANHINSVVPVGHLTLLFLIGWTLKSFEISQIKVQSD